MSCAPEAVPPSSHPRKGLPAMVVLALKLVSRRFVWFGLASLGILLWIRGCTKPTPAPPPPVPDASAGWTLLVRSSGPHWLSPDWWQSQGLDPASLDPARVSLYSSGAPAPALWLDSPQGRGMLFWAELSTAPRLAALGAYTLTVNAADAAPRAIPAFSGDTLAPQDATLDTVHLESDLAYRSTAPLDSPWLWASLYPPNAFTLTVPLTDVVPGPVTLTLHLWGQSSMPQNPDHHAQAFWNGEPVGDHLWDGDGAESWTLALPGAVSGDNALVWRLPGDLSTEVELVWLDAVEVTWRRALRAGPGPATWLTGDADGACWDAPEGERRALFATSAGQVYDGGTYAVEPGTPLCLAQPLDARGWFGVPWKAPAPELARPRQVLTDSALLDADYLVIAPQPFHAALSPLIEARRAEGFRPLLATPEQVYDTYGTGLPDADALHALVARAQGAGRLRYVLLVGDTSADPQAAWNPLFVPTGWTRTANIGETPSDYELVAAADGSVAVAVGRFPVSTVAELEALVSKTLAWQPNRRLMLFADDEGEFAGLNDTLAGVYPVDAQLDAAGEDARAALLDWLKAGPGTLVYSGHGSLPMLGDEQILTAKDAGAWDGPTVMLAWTCLCASFSHPRATGLSEAWLRDDGNVVAVIGPTAETTTSEQSAMAVAVQATLATGAPLGDALLAGWRASESRDVRVSFLLLGDPALRPFQSVEETP
ncbi:MAG: hypothetical protein JXA21_21720 [Anaerolineae bacterium]|nr:hypothetical protein [Anaerolineae bacterium]